MAVDATDEFLLGYTGPSTGAGEWLVAERDAHLADAERASANATAVEGAIRILDHLLSLAQKPEETHESV